MKLDNIAKAVDSAVLALEEKARGAVCIASIDDQIWFLESFGQLDPEEDWKKLVDAVKDNKAFNPLSCYDNDKTAVRVEARLACSEWRAILDIVIEPERMYGSKMSLRWSPIERAEKTTESAVWEWQDMNAISRHVIGYAIMGSQTRTCLVNWTFLSE